MFKESKYYQEIIEKLEKLTKREYKNYALLGFQIALMFTLLVFLTFSFIELFIHSSGFIRTIFFSVFILLAIVTFVVLFVIPFLKSFNLFRKTDYQKVAEKVGRNFPEIKDDLLNAMQLVSGEDSEKVYSHGLIDAAFQNIYKRTKEIKFESIVNFKKAKELAYYSSGTALLFILLVFFVPSLNASATRLIEFNKEFVQPPKFIIKVQPGNTQITKGDDVLITVEIEGDKPKELFLETKNSEQTGFQKEQILADSLGRFNFKIKTIRSSFQYYVSSGDIKSNKYKVEVVDRPIVKSLDLKIISPSYTKIPPVIQKDNGNVTALVGSNVDINISSTKKITQAYLFFSDSSKKELSVSNNNANGKFVVKNDKNYQIRIVDENQNENISPINYSVKVLYDAYPGIEIIEPNENTSLPNDNRVPLETKVTDDYGFTKLLLYYRLSSSKYEQPQKDFKSIEIPFTKNVTEADVKYIWNLTQLNLATEDVVTYYLEIFDNDIISGPKSTKSPLFNLRVPTLDEILSKADNTQNKSTDKLQESLKQAEELKQELQEISQTMKQNKKELSWDEKQKIQQAMDKFENLQKQVSDVKKQLDKMQQELKQNNLLSKETLQKYMELQKLFKELNNDEMKKALEKMQDALQSMMRQQSQEAMENFKMNEDAFKKSIERTMNLLKRIQVAQKVDELQKRVEQIAKDQESLKKETSDNNLQNQDENKQMNEKQNDIKNNLDELSKQMDELNKKMSELKDLPKDQLEKLQSEFQKQQNQKLSEQASQNIQQQQKQQAMQNQQQIAQNMKQMQKNIQSMQQSMQQQNQIQNFKDMMRLTDNLVTLSKQQEELKNESKNLDPSSSSFNQNAQKQNDIQKNLDNIMQQLSKISQKTFAITPEMGKALGDAKKNMNKAIEQMQNRNGNSASSNQGDAMKSLNQAAAMLKSSMESMMQGGGQGGGMMSLMQQLGKMSGQQMGINNLSQMLQQSMHGKMSMEQRAQMQKLGQQQELVRKSLEQLNKEAQLSGQSKKIPADLQEIAKQMQEVVTNMKSDDLNDKTTQLQEKILSKLLDAQRSVNERDYEKEREAKTGEDIQRKSPADLNFSLDKDKDKLKDALNKAVREGYSKDYQDLIRKYYEALQKQTNNN